MSSISQSAEMPAETSSAAPEMAGLPMPRRLFATLAVMATLVLVVLDGAIANVALPTIHTDLQVSAAATVWVVTAYQLALVMGLLPGAALGESLGYRRVFLAGIVVFTGASVLCALAPSLMWLVVARFVQGLGAAPLMALAVALLRHVFPREMMGRVIGWNALVIALAAAIGPTIGAAILSVASWPWIFAVNVPIGILVLVAARFLPAPSGSGRGLDGLSVVLNAAGFGCLVLGADAVIGRPETGVPLLAVAAASFIALVRREAPRRAPLIPLDLLRRRSFRLSVIASVCCFSAQMSSYVALPFIFQHGLGLSALLTGICMTPWPLVVAFAGPISGRLSDRIHGGILCAVGGATLAAGLALSALWPLGGSPLPLVAMTMLCGLGFGLFQVPNNRNMLVSVEPERAGAAGGMQGTARLVGQTAGGLIMTVLFTLTPAEVAPHMGLGVGAVLAALAGGVSALRVRAE
ncbi:DHA2 family multidrug resistance protein-like MFS transporter [Breoghania corrubedonensis]|uniref:DHA2 family multidrug resistance protein-like MFS transporter n=1 Tax=Breoghania corrubedonensis TaxID=665038 RepID=A0A2T5V7H1_9HYPH|nr:MFS transporter [Breoghania corrubedonensis]PTW59697.1 DHA2 family multidrug resistance protein-like MFS transporter [Breoghania corrubedonensis]